MATKKKTGKKKSPAQLAKEDINKAARRFVKALQTHQETYEKLHESLGVAQSADERRTLLEELAINNQSLKSLVPPKGALGCDYGTLLSKFTLCDK